MSNTRNIDSPQILYQDISHALTFGTYPDEQIKSRLHSNGLAHFERIQTKYTISVDVIKRAVLNFKPNLRSTGLKIRNTLIKGFLELDFIEVPWPLEFVDCEFAISPSFKRASIPQLILMNTKVPGLTITGAKIDGNANFNGLIYSTQIQAENLIVGGCLCFNGMQFEKPQKSSPELDEPKILLDGSKISGDLMLSRTRISGNVSIRDASIGGQLAIVDSILSNPHKEAISMDGSRIAGDLACSNLVAVGEVCAIDTSIGGQLNLSNAYLINENSDALNFDHSEIAGGAFLDDMTAIGRVRAMYTHIGTQLYLAGAKIENRNHESLSLDHVNISGDLRLERLQINGGVYGRTTRNIIRERSAKILGHGGSDKDKYPESTHKSRAFGAVSLVSAHISGQLQLGAADICSVSGDALVFDQIQVTGGVRLTNLRASAKAAEFRTGGTTGLHKNKFHPTAAVRGVGASINGRFDLTGAILQSLRGHALNLAGAEIKGDVILNELESIGKVHAVGLHTSGQLIANHATLTNRSGVALNLDLASIVGDAHFDNLQAIGGSRRPPKAIHTEGPVIFEQKPCAVRCVGAQFFGQVYFKDATLVNYVGNTLNLRNTRIAGDLDLRNLTSFGTVVATAIHVDGRVKFGESYLVSETGDALILDRAEVSGGVSLAGIRARGGTNGERWHSGPEPTAPAPEQTDSETFNRTKVTGVLRAVNARIAGDVDLSGSVITSSQGGIALNLFRSRIDTLLLDDVQITSGRINLASTSIRNLTLGPPSSRWPLLFSAQGWQLGSVHGGLLSNRNAAIRWLDTPTSTNQLSQNARLMDVIAASENNTVSDSSNSGHHKKDRGFSSQPWKELSRVYAEMGRPSDAKWLRFQAARRTNRAAPPFSKVVGAIYEFLVGYGLYPFFALVWLGLLLVLTACLSATFAADFRPSNTSSIVEPTGKGSTQDLITSGDAPAKTDFNGSSDPISGYPVFSPWLVAVDTALPPAAFPNTAWRVENRNGLLPLGLAFIRVFGWILTALFLAGVTGLLKKE